MKKVNFDIKKIVFISIGTICASLLVIYIAMLWDTNSVIKQIEQHFTGEIPLNEEFNSYDSNIPDKLYIYNFNHMKKEGYTEAEKDKVKFKLKRNYVLHNFKDGIMKFTYSLRYCDKNNEMQYSAGGVPVLLKIHKENGEWKIIERYEDP